MCLYHDLIDMLQYVDILFYAYVLVDMTTLGYANDGGYLIVTNNRQNINSQQQVLMLVRSGFKQPPVVCACYTDQHNGGTSLPGRSESCFVS